SGTPLRHELCGTDSSAGVYKVGANAKTPIGRVVGHSDITPPVQMYELPVIRPKWDHWLDEPMGDLASIEEHLLLSLEAWPPFIPRA
ncbi:MAG TPA: hypothetical protein VJU82_11765, partial [Acidobacteriaceae bacterium]|nr:hypothetical protein [Acidobacteriaceae bacterium]